MFDSHITAQYRLTTKELFDYFTNFEEYPTRYQKYCGKINIMEKSENIVITSEFWNIESAEQEVLIEVQYLLVPHTEIRYEIIGGDKIGIKNKMEFSESKNYPFKSIAEFSLPILDLVGRSIGKDSVVYQDLSIYLSNQDGLFMHNIQNTRFALGQTCSLCKKGKLGGLPSQFTANADMSSRVKVEVFECDLCHETFSNSMGISVDRIAVG